MCFNTPFTFCRRESAQACISNHHSVGQIQVAVVFLDEKTEFEAIFALPAHHLVVSLGQQRFDIQPALLFWKSGFDGEIRSTSS
jgi:hypothetical protein